MVSNRKSDPNREMEIWQHEQHRFVSLNQRSRMRDKLAARFFLHADDPQVGTTWKSLVEVLNEHRTELRDPDKPNVALLRKLMGLFWLDELGAYCRRRKTRVGTGRLRGKAKKLRDLQIFAASRDSDATEIAATTGLSAQYVRKIIKRGTRERWVRRT